MLLMAPELGGPQRQLRSRKLISCDVSFEETSLHLAQGVSELQDRQTEPLAALGGGGAAPQCGC